METTPDEEERSGDRTDRREALLKWWAFGVMFPLLPVIARALGIGLLSPTVNTFQRDDWINYLLGGGDLLIIATVIAAAGIGEVFLSSRAKSAKERRRGGRAIVWALFIAVCSVLLYAYGAVTIPDFPDEKGIPRMLQDAIAVKLGWISLVLFSASLCVGHRCISITYRGSPEHKSLLSKLRRWLHIPGSRPDADPGPAEG